MRFFDVIRVLELKVDQIDQTVQDGQWTPRSVDIIETAFWARSVLDIVENVKLNRYGHSLKTTIPTTRSISDSDHPGSAKAAYKKNKNISLRKLLGFVIHFRYFAFYRHADGNHCLDVMSDYKVRQQVYYSDFTAALRSLVLSERLVALVICDLVEEDLLGKENTPLADANSRIFAEINLFYLLHEHMKGETELKLMIMEEIFGIIDIPDELLPSLAFFQSMYEQEKKKMKIGFGPPWENEQNVFSPWFDQCQLFNLIRNYYVNLRNSSD